MATVTIKHKLDELKQDLIFSWYCDQKPEISIDGLKSAWQLGYTPSSEPTPCLLQLLISSRALRENPFLAFWSLPALLTCGHITTFSRTASSNLSLLRFHVAFSSECVKLSSDSLLQGYLWWYLGPIWIMQDNCFISKFLVY